MLPEPVPLSIANWNVHNFINDQFDDPAPQEAVDNQWPAHRAAVGNVLNAIDVDILMLQEVEHEAGLEELNDMELSGAYPHITVIDANDPRGIDIGIMSKVPLDDVISHQDESFTKAGTNGPSYIFARDVLEVHLTVNGRQIVLLGVHFKAKDNDDPDKRLAEAQRTRAIADAITSASPGAAVIILGDFNDLPASPPYLAVTGSAPDAYTNAPQFVSAANQWTFDFNGQLELVDHQMVNPLMAERLEQSTVRIVHGPEVDAASDHAPVIATYQVN
jgi:endonuclease/exonuclease/phosphatase family metal-dependent hydrolase